MGKRILYLDVARAIAMFLVVFGHVIVDYDSREFQAPASIYIYSFHTALFMFLSGYFFGSNLKKSLKFLVKEKTRQLLLPYLCWWVLYLFIIDIPENNFDVVKRINIFLMGGGISWLLVCQTPLYLYHSNLVSH